MKKVHNPHDAYFKRTLARPGMAAEFLRHYLPRHIVRLLDLATLRLEPDSFVDAKLRRHFSDLLYQVRLQGGATAYIYILLEHKSAPEEWVALQLLRYLTQMWERLRQGGSDLNERIEEMVNYLLAAERVSQTEVVTALTTADQPGGDMETFLTKWRKEAEREGRKIGRKEGRKEGRAEGRAEGEQQGEQKGVLKLTLRQLQRRVGELDEATQDRVHALTLPQLQRLGEALLDFQTHDDLDQWLAALARPARKRQRQPKA